MVLGLVLIAVGDVSLQEQRDGDFGEHNHYDWRPKPYIINPKTVQLDEHAQRSTHKRKLCGDSEAAQRFPAPQPIL